MLVRGVTCRRPGVSGGGCSAPRDPAPSASAPPRPAGSDDGTVRFWEVCTARCMKTLPVGGAVKSVAWNPNPAVCLVAVCA